MNANTIQRTLRALEARLGERLPMEERRAIEFDYCEGVNALREIGAMPELRTHLDWFHQYLRIDEIASAYRGGSQ